MPKEVYAIEIGKEFWLKQGEGIGGKEGYQTIGNFVSAILPNVYIIAGVILFILLFAGGFVIITSAGEPDKQQQGSKAVTAAVIGFVIIFVSYWIIQIIEHLTGMSILAPKI